MQVLYIEDNSLDRIAFERVIQNSYLSVHYDSAETLRDGLLLIRSGEFDVIFVDLRLPDGSALDLLRELGDCDSIIVVLTGVSDVTTAVQAIKSGAYDYIVKDVSREYLVNLPDYLEKISNTLISPRFEEILHGISSSSRTASLSGIVIRNIENHEILYYNSWIASHSQIKLFTDILKAGRDSFPVWERICSAFRLPPDITSPDGSKLGEIIRHRCDLPGGDRMIVFSAMIPDGNFGFKQLILWFKNSVDIHDPGNRSRSANSDSLSVLASGIAHEMNNVLTSILGEVSLARQFDPSDAGSREPCFDRTDLAILYGKDIACRLLTYADGGYPMVKQVILKDLIQEALSLYHQRENPIVVDIPDDLPYLLIDPDLMRTAMRAVITNAMEASGSSPIYIRAHLSTCHSEPGLDLSVSYILVDIRDEGSGFGANERICAFNPFFTTKEGHLGLGLSSAKSIVQKHLGEIQILDTPDAGSLIRLSLPIAYSPLSLQSSENKEDRGRSSGTRVLVMDDEPGIREILQLILQKEGFEVDVFSRGEDAVQAVFDAYESLNPYQVVILDMVIPGGMGGKEAVLEIKKIHPSTIAIVSSGYSDDNVSSRYSDYGFQASLPKPYHPKEMINLVFLLLTEYYTSKYTD